MADFDFPMEVHAHCISTGFIKPPKTAQVSGITAKMLLFRSVMLLNVIINPDPTTPKMAFSL